MNVGFLSAPRPPVVLTAQQSRAFACVANAAAGTFRVPPGPSAAALNTALHGCEAAGLVMRAGRGWKLTPHGVLRRADMHALAGKPR